MFDKKRLIDRHKMTQYYEQLKPQMEERLQLLEAEIGDMAFPFRYLYYQNQSLISTGNSVTLLNNGEEKFPALYTALQNARSDIHIGYYILNSDDVGNQITDILINKKKEGVEVRVQLLPSLLYLHFLQLSTSLAERLDLECVTDVDLHCLHIDRAPLDFSGNSYGQIDTNRFHFTIRTKPFQRHKLKRQRR